MGSRDPNCVTFVSDPFADQTKTGMINRPEKLPLDLNDVMYTSVAKGFFEEGVTPPTSQESQNAFAK